MITVKDSARGIIMRTGCEFGYNEVIYGVYGRSADITFIMKDKLNKEDGFCVSTEVVGFHYGEPDMDFLLAYIGRLKAEF